MTVMVELTRPRKLIPRWATHGDLTLAIRDGRVYARADQLEHLAGITPWSTGETLIEDTWPVTIDGHPYYDLDVAVARCEAVATDLAASFLEWLEVTLELILTDEALDEAQHLPSFLGSYTVRRAAEILNNDPAVSIGQNSLFLHMEAIGWVQRDGDYWTITAPTRRNGWLTIRNVPVRNRTYPQIYITRDGLAQLRSSLHSLHRPETDQPPPPALFD